MVSETNGKRINQVAIFFSIFTLFLYVVGFLGLTQFLGAAVIYIQYISLALAVILTIAGRGKELNKLSFKILAFGVGGILVLYLLIVVLWVTNAQP
ncbi:hypothetical protein CON53_31375 [Bacillus cereus]|nr:hypothetical protein CON53_31375 [Bacillus cereus]PFH88486.1 hypothetical protein COI81_13445 [Bacillus cereus]PFM51647.1 hypothetical protein COJ52_26390 [Bacillus cereus]PGS18634.1 hypothetical protein COC55_30895 [Bacillus cereus]